MNENLRTVRARHIAAIAFIVLALVLGLLYYISFRDTAVLLVASWTPWLNLHNLAVVSVRLPEHSVWQSIPSFLHAFATFLAVQVWVSGAPDSRSYCKLPTLLLLLVLEAVLGYSTWLDALAIVVGLCAAELLAHYLGLSTQRLQDSTVGFRLPDLAVIVSASSLLAVGSDYGDDIECARYDDSGGSCIEYKRAAEPVYMSYQRLRESVQVQAARPPDRIGRVYLYEGYIFLNEVNEGIHVIDNADPTEPVNIGFIQIPGNTEIAIRGNYLYADSYIDLVTLDLNDPGNVQLIDRQQDVFPYEATQNIPYNISFRRFDIDQQQGVVVSYRLSGS